MKIRNQEITINVLDKNRKVVYTNTKKNRIVDNYLDYTLFHELPNDISGGVFPKFANLVTGPPSYNSINSSGVNNCYIKFTTKDIINDSSTNFNFDLNQGAKDGLFYSQYSGSGAIAEATFQFEFEIDATYADQLLTQVGFGLLTIDVNASPFNDWLCAWIDVDLLGIRIPEGFFLQIQRKDYATNLKNVNSSEGSMYILEEQAKIERIQVLNETDEVLYDYGIRDVTITNTATGEITISGIGTFSFCDTDPFYPCDDVYPCTDIYPSGGNLKKVKIFMEAYQKVTQNDFTIEYNAKDLDVTYDGDTITLKIIIERGDI